MGVLRAYLRWQLVSSLAPLLTHDFVREAHNFELTLLNYLEPEEGSKPVRLARASNLQTRQQLGVRRLCATHAPCSRRRVSLAQRLTLTNDTALPLEAIETKCASQLEELVRRSTASSRHPTPPHPTPTDRVPRHRAAPLTRAVPMHRRRCPS